MDAPSILITQCLQHDFIAPVEPGTPLPNLLHIGHDESRRLLGLDGNGPIRQMVAWAASQPEDRIEFIHIRDWHDPADPHQASHLQQFGEHCVAGSRGAEFVFTMVNAPNRHIINSTTLNDFDGTGLATLLDRYKGRPIRVGITGVWTEAKVMFLAYELATRYPGFELAVCSALTASSSRSQHFYALEQLRRIIGVTVIDSLGEFIEFLGGSIEQTLPQSIDKTLEVVINGSIHLDPESEQLLRYLFRDCKKITLKVLDGGFSGNIVAAVTSIDMHGQEQAPHVVKIGPRELMARERTAFEKIETVLGNNAPAVADYADLKEKGAIKYRYASMGSGSTVTFQSGYMKGASADKVQKFLKDVYETQLGRFYRAAVDDKQDLLAYYEFSPKWAESVRGKIEQLIGPIDSEADLTLPGGQTCPNLYHFYKHELGKLPPIIGDFPFSFVHGDLNGANIIIDENENVWLIDFFHTHRGHVLKDFVKLENDLLYIYTPIDSEDDLKLAYRFTDFILSFDNPLVVDKPLPDCFKGTQLERTFATLTVIRSLARQYIRADSPQQKLQWLIPQLRYAVHTIGFDEPNERQIVWACYTASKLSIKVIMTS